MKLTKTTLLIAATLVMASTNSFAASKVDLNQFTFADKNKDGQVTVAEMETFSADLMKRRSNAKWVIKLVKKHGENAPKENAKAWIKRNDKNADGVITLDEVSA